MFIGSKTEFVKNTLELHVTLLGDKAPSSVLALFKIFVQELG